jgi:hypothetical protein
MRRLEHRQIAFRFSGEGAKPVFEVKAVGQGYPAPFDREKRAPEVRIRSALSPFPAFGRTLQAVGDPLRQFN